MSLFNKTFLIIVFVTFVIATYQNRGQDHVQDYLATRNNKIYALGYMPKANQKNGEGKNLEKIWIFNDQQSIRIELPVLAALPEEKYPVGNYSELFPLFFNNLKTKGYIKPLNPYAEKSQMKTFLKGYKYLKPNQNEQKTDQIILQIEHLLQNVIKENGLGFLSIRTEDSFELQITVNSQKTSLTITSIQVKYLFATIEKDVIPKQTMSQLNKKLINYQQYQKQQGVGTVERRLHGKGLHQWVNTTILLDDKIDIQLQSIKSKCHYEFTDILPESTYVDADQRRVQTTNFETINVQKPAFASKQYFYVYRVELESFQESGVNKYLYQQPVHFRYPQPSQLNITTVYLHPIQTARIVCDQNEGQQKRVYQLKQNHLFDRGVAKIPMADSSMIKIVPVVTLTVCLIAVLKIYTTLKRGSP